MPKTKREPAYLEVNCPECGKQFKSEEEMLKHYYPVHEGIPYESIQQQSKGEKWVEETILPKLKVSAGLSQDLSEVINRAILWQNEEALIDYMNCRVL